MPARRMTGAASLAIACLVCAGLVGCGTKKLPSEPRPILPEDVKKAPAPAPAAPKVVTEPAPPPPAPAEPKRVVEAPAPPAEPEWQDIFDGKTLDGWEQKGGKAQYSVRDGAVVGSTVVKTPNSFLCTKEHYTDFVLELEFKVAPGLNSGVQIRSNSFEEYKKGRVHGYQVEIDPSKRAWTGGIYDEGRRGWLNNLKDNEPARKAFRQNEWNRFRIEAVGDSIKTWLNGVPAADLTDSKTAKGFIGLQVHGCKTAGLEVMWRNIRLKDLASGGR